MYTARWIPLNVLRNSPVQLSAMFRVTSGLMTVYCSCPGVLPLKAPLLYALHFFNTERKKKAFWPHIVFMYFKLFYEKAVIILLKIKGLIFCLQKFSVNLLHIFVVYTQHTKHLIPKLSAHEQISECLDTRTIFKILFNFIFFKLYLIVF